VCPCRVARGPPPHGPTRRGRPRRRCYPLGSVRCRGPGCRCRPRARCLPPPCWPFDFSSSSFVNVGWGGGRFGVVWFCDVRGLRILERLELAGGRPGHRLTAPLMRLAVWAQAAAQVMMHQCSAISDLCSGNAASRTEWMHRATGASVSCHAGPRKAIH